MSEKKIDECHYKTFFHKNSISYAVKIWHLGACQPRKHTKVCHGKIGPGKTGPSRPILDAKTGPPRPLSVTKIGPTWPKVVWT